MIVLDKLTELREQQRSIMEAVQREKRNFTEDEQRTLALLNEQIRFQKDELDLQDRKQRTQQQSLSGRELQRNFAKQLEEMVRSQKRSVTIETRSDDFITTANHGTDNVIPVLQQDLLKPFEKGLVLSQIGHKTLTNVHGKPIWPLIDSLEASIEGEIDEVGYSTLNIDKIVSSPKRLSLAVPVSNLALNQSNLDLYNIILGELGLGVARKINRIVFSGEEQGTFTPPFYNMNGQQKLSTSEYTHASLVELEHKVLDHMLDAMSPLSCYVLNSRTAQKLKTITKVKGQSEMLLQEFRNPNGGIQAFINGFPALYCNYVPEGVIQFGDFRWLGIAQFGQMDIKVDPFSLLRKDSVAFVMNTSIDVVTLRPEAFASLTKA